MKVDVGVQYEQYSGSSYDNMQYREGDTAACKECDDGYYYIAARIFWENQYEQKKVRCMAVWSIAVDKGAGLMVSMVFLPPATTSKTRVGPFSD